MHSCNPPIRFPPRTYSGSVPSPTTIKSGAGDTDQTNSPSPNLPRNSASRIARCDFMIAAGLLSPQREGRRRIFSRADRDRLALILKGKKLGFTLAEISQMIEAQSGQASEQTLKLTAEKCLEQIAYFERQMREASRGAHRAATDSSVAVRADGAAWKARRRP